MALRVPRFRADPPSGSSSGATEPTTTRKAAPKPASRAKAAPASKAGAKAKAAPKKSAAAPRSTAKAKPGGKAKSGSAAKSGSRAKRAVKSPAKPGSERSRTTAAASAPAPRRSLAAWWPRSGRAGSAEPEKPAKTGRSAASTKPSGSGKSASAEEPRTSRWTRRKADPPSAPPAPPAPLLQRRSVAALLARGLVLAVLVVAMVAFAVALAKVTLVPEPGSDALVHTNLRPGASIRAYLDQPDTRDTIKQIGGNILLGVPFGILLPTLFPRTRGLVRVVVVTALVMLVVETTQGAIVEGRAFDIDDVILNTAGALLGYLALGRRLGRALHPRRTHWYHRFGYGTPPPPAPGKPET